jgi:hypothetical protein
MSVISRHSDIDAFGPQRDGARVLAPNHGAHWIACLE